MYELDSVRAMFIPGVDFNYSFYYHWFLELACLKYFAGYWRAKNAGGVEPHEPHCFNLEGNMLLIVFVVIIILIELT